jgi:hypothetical protein
MAANKENAKTGNLDELHPDSEHDAMDLPSEEHSCKMPNLYEETNEAYLHANITTRAPFVPNS